MNVLKKIQLLAFILPLSFLAAFCQSGSSSIEQAVDYTEYERILEYYSYDKEIPIDPIIYG